MKNRPVKPHIRFDILERKKAEEIAQLDDEVKSIQNNHHAIYTT
jgi:hypothetical protein